MEELRILVLDPIDRENPGFESIYYGLICLALWVFLL